MNTIIFNTDGSIKDTAIASTAKTELSDAPGTYVLNGIAEADGYPITFDGKCLLIIPGSTQSLVTTQILYANGVVYHRASASDEWADENDITPSVLDKVTQLENKLSTLTFTLEDGNLVMSYGEN